MWRPAYSLQTLKDQLDATYPGWLFLGFLGDQAHASVPSDHNPNAQGVVTALDIGPGGGLNIHALADRLAESSHPDLKYIISNRRIAEWQYGFKWRAYNGSDPHDTHIHVSVGRGDDGQSVQPYDDRINWNVTEEEPVETFKDSNDVRVNGFGLFGIDVPGSDPVLVKWVGKPKLDFYKGLGPQVVNNMNALQKQLAEAQKGFKPVGQLYEKG